MSRPRTLSFGWTKHSRWITPALIVLATLAAFFPTLQNGFVNWDDGYNFVNNPHYRGLGWAQIRWMFTSFSHLGHYVPLTWLTLGLDYLLWGMNPAGYHLTGLVFHAAVAVVFYFLTLRLLGLATQGAAASPDGATRIAATFAALLFSVHPLRVESVAWATERRDVVSGLFFLLTIIAYLRAGAADPNSRPHRLWLNASLLGFAAAILSKEIVMTLPVVLLVLDAYPLRRLKLDERRAWREKLPFWLLAAAGAAIAILARDPEGRFAPLEEHGIMARIAQAAFGLLFYLRKTLLPLGLSPFYPLSVPLNPLATPFVLSGLVVLAITGGLLAARHRFPAGLAVWIYFFTVLSPVLGFAQQGEQIVADRYSYLASFGLAVLGGAGLLRILRARERGAIGRPLVLVTLSTAVGIVALYGMLTWRQVGIWHDSITLWTRVLEITPDSYFAHYNLANALSRSGRIPEAIGHYRHSLELDPVQPEAHNNLGNIFSAAGKPAEAIMHYQRSLEIDPTQAKVRLSLGNVLVGQGKYAAAAEQYRKALQIRPNHAETHNNLGIALAEQGKTAEAVVAYRQAIRLEPSLINAHNNLGNVLLSERKFIEAAAAYQEALKLKPNYAHARFNLARLYLELHQREAALEQQRILADIEPNMARRLAEMMAASHK